MDTAYINGQKKKSMRANGRMVCNMDLVYKIVNQKMEELMEFGKMEPILSNLILNKKQKNMLKEILLIRI